PLDLELICLKCLEKDPARRYADCQELADDLRRWLDGEPVLVRPPSVAERFLRWMRKSPTVAALTLTVLLGLLLGVGVGWGLAAWAVGEGKTSRQNAEDAQRQKDRADEKTAEAQAKARRAEAAGHALQLETATQALRQGKSDQAIAILSSARVE